MTKATALKVVPAKKKISPIVGDTPIIFGGFRIFNVNVSFADLVSDFRENSHQRDTELRSTKHLLPVVPEHLEVACMITMTGDKVLLNGHTRRLFWKNNTAIAPAVVRMTVYEIIDPSINAADEEYRLYSSYDSRKAVKTSAHTVQSAMRVSGFAFETQWMRAGQFVEALRSAADFCGAPGVQSFREADVSVLMKHFEKEMNLFDQIAPAKKRWPVGFMAAALIMLKKAPTVSVLRVLNGYNINMGSKSENGLHNPLSLMNEFRRDGLSDTGMFPSDRANVLSAVTKMSRLIYLALTAPDTMMKKDGRHVEPFSREELKKLIVPAEIVAKMI